MIKLTKNKIRWIILFICLVIFLFIAEDVFNKEMMKADIIGYNLVSKYLISENVTPIVKIITNLGGAFTLITISIISIVIIRDKKIGISILLNLLSISALNLALKNILQRPRPNEFRIIDESGYSFPSGHSMISMAFYGFIIYLIYKNVKNNYLKYGLIAFLSILIFLIGISRIYLGVHYTSDVIAGFLISIAYLMIVTSFAKKYLNSKGME